MEFPSFFSFDLPQAPTEFVPPIIVVNDPVGQLGVYNQALSNLGSFSTFIRLLFAVSEVGITSITIREPTINELNDPGFAYTTQFVPNGSNPQEAEIIINRFEAFALNDGRVVFAEEILFHEIAHAAFNQQGRINDNNCIATPDLAGLYS